MALRTIVLDGDPILTKVCRPVTDFGEKTAQLLDDMKETLLEANGLGLAGPQVGVMRRLCIVLDVGEENDGTAPEEGEELPEYEFIELINPEIIDREGAVTIYEGCLSFPGRNGAIERPEQVTVRAFDRNGKEFTATKRGIVARAICHECNHLDGITILDLADHFYEDTEEGMEEE